MQEEEAHILYQHFQKTDAAAKQKQVQCCARRCRNNLCCFHLFAAFCCTQGLGFGSSPAPSPVTVVDSDKTPAGWEAPYKLSDKFQQAHEVSTRKHSRSSYSHRHSPERRQRAHSSSSPEGSRHHSRDKAVHHWQSDKQQGHSSRQKHREELHHSSSRKRHSEPPDGRHHRTSHHRTRYSDSPHDPQYHSSKHSDSKRDSNKHSRREEESTHSRHKQHRSHHSEHRSSREDHRQHRSRSGDDHTNRAPKAPDYAKLIVGYKYMSDANRLKAVTAYKLSKTSAKVQSGPPCLTSDHLSSCTLVDLHGCLIGLNLCMLPTAGDCHQNH